MYVSVPGPSVGRQPGSGLRVRRRGPRAHYSPGYHPEAQRRLPLRPFYVQGLQDARGALRLLRQLLILPGGKGPLLRLVLPRETVSGFAPLGPVPGPWPGRGSGLTRHAPAGVRGPVRPRPPLAQHALRPALLSPKLPLPNRKKY
ncbi:hypothetical protein FOCC_FOCC012317, partial [Frankliniella occidentalis]